MSSSKYDPDDDFDPDSPHEAVGFGDGDELSDLDADTHRLLRAVEHSIESTKPVRKPRKPRTKKAAPASPVIKLRDLGYRGIRESNRTSFRLSDFDRDLLAQLANRLRDELGLENFTKSAMLRQLIRAEARKVGILPSNSNKAAE